jgi:hypothetical protein
VRIRSQDICFGAGDGDAFRCQYPLGGVVVGILSMTLWAFIQHYYLVGIKKSESWMFTFVWKSESTSMHACMHSLIE